MARQSTHQTKANPEKSPRRDPTASGDRDAAVNRIASHNYFLLEKFEAGVVLTGTEVKSVRGGLANLKDSYGLVKDDAVWLLNAHIGPYEHGNIHNHAPLRTRKLLIGLAVAEGILKLAALIDIKRRPASQIRGRKWVWASVVAVVSSAGVIPISYFIFGRRQTERQVQSQRS